MARSKGKKPPTREKPVYAHPLLEPSKLEEIRDMAGLGLYDKDIAQCLGYNRTYFAELKRLHPELADALKEGASKGTMAMAKVICDAAKSRNVVAAMFYLKCKAGWRDNATSNADDDNGESGNRESVHRRILEDVRRVRAKQ